ncbi:MAG: uracil-DNA glycosylase family protein [Verrucomicrobia bacterium]|nr:uracil-DNA glycosylase family protein [Verrucomicrobiota bacterium]
MNGRRDRRTHAAGALTAHVQSLRACALCPQMHKPVVSGGANVSEVLLLGQAPGDKEPVFQKPWAWTAGKTLFRWFEESADLNEMEVRTLVYIAAVCRCFPGKKPTGGDRVPAPEEIRNCSRWLDAELNILQPGLVIAVGKLAIEQFLVFRTLEDVVGKKFSVDYDGIRFDLVPLPHPSGASPWHRMEPGKTLLLQAMQHIVQHSAFKTLMAEATRATSNP